MAAIQPRPLANLAHDAGFRDDDLFTACCVCYAETRANPSYLFDGPDEQCLGLMGISFQKPVSPLGLKMMDPVINMAAAYQLFGLHGWDSWASHLDGRCWDDEPIQYALLGVSNRWGELAVQRAKTVLDTRIPWVSTAQLRKIYPTVQI